MMLDNLYPRTKSELLRAIQKMRVNKIEIIDGYVPNDERNLLKTAREMAAGNHDLTVILVRS